MFSKLSRSLMRRSANVICGAMAMMTLASAAILPYQEEVQASSHREAPLISQDQYADNTDTYVFIPPKNPDNVVLVASWIPFEGPEGGPNYFEWGKDVLYDIYVDNDGDAKADLTYTLSSRTEVQNPLTFLYNVGPIKQNTDATWNRRQYVTITETREDGTVKTLVNDQLTTPVNIGSKSTPRFKDLERDAIFNYKEGNDRLKLYAGQTDDAFWVDLQVFDLLTLRGQKPPIGYNKGNNDPVDSVSGFNVHSLVIEAPISRLTNGTEPVLGVWAGSRRRTTTVLGGGSASGSGDYVQVSRLGMPLVNEVVLPYALKDAFNGIKPETDLAIYTGALGPDAQQIIQKSVEDPEIGNLLCGLYGVPLPGDANKDCKTEFAVGTPRSGRGDIFDIFLTGFKLAKPFEIVTKNGKVTLPAGTNVNQPANPNIPGGVVPAEMIRINTAIKGDLCSPKPSRLGVLGGDACGFPNGRRLTDDTVEIELLAVAGAAYQVIDGRDAAFTFNPALIGVLTDGVDYNDVSFRSTFPYMGRAQSGQEHIHQNSDDDDDVNAAGLDAAEAAEDEQETEESSDAGALNNKIYAPVIEN